MLDQGPPALIGFQLAPPGRRELGHVDGQPGHAVDLPVVVVQRELGRVVAAHAAVRVDKLLVENVCGTRAFDSQVVAAVGVGKIGREHLVVGPAEHLLLQTQLPDQWIAGQDVPALQVLCVDVQIGFGDDRVHHALVLAQCSLCHHRRRDLCRQVLSLPAQFQLTDHLAGQRRQILELGVVELAGYNVHHAQRAQHVDAGRHQRGTGAEPDPRFTRHQWMVGEAGVGVGVRDDDHLGRPRWVLTHGQFPWSAGQVDADPGLEPQSIAVRQADDGHRHIAAARGQCRQVVEGRLGRGVQHAEASQRIDPGSLEPGGAAVRVDSLLDV
jgi:hypothetical protein